ncbi:MAG: sulfatase family protein [bacterium]
MSPNYSRRQFLSSLAGAAAALPLFNSAAFSSLKKLTSAQPRNIIFILSDDHRYDCFGFTGRPKFLRTPNFNRLAQQGAHMQNTFVTTSLCSPSRASILTGKYPFAHGVVDNDSPMPPGNIFFPTYLQEAGYKAAFIGKWHMGHHTDEPQPGFNRWVSFPGQGVYYDPEFNIDGTRKKHTGYITDLLTDYAVEWINAQRNNRFFLYLSHKAVHAMFEPAKRHLGKYEKVALEYPATMANTEANYRNKPRWVRAQRNSWHGVDYMYHGEMDFDTFYQRYCETFLAVDDSIGRLVEALEKNDLLESTLILYTSDNGFSFGEHGLIDKRHMYEESVRIPLLAHCPELIKPNTEVSEFIQNVDFAPTILEAAGYQAPAEMEGKSFLSLLKGEKTPWRDAIFYFYFWERPFPHTPTMLGIRTAQYKYITYHGIWDTDELYDMQNDPNETENLIDRAEHKGLIEALRKRIFDWLEEKNATAIPLRRSGLWQAAERDVHFDH